MKSSKDQNRFFSGGIFSPIHFKLITYIDNCSVYVWRRTANTIKESWSSSFTKTVPPKSLELFFLHSGKREINVVQDVYIEGKPNPMVKYLSLFIHFWYKTKVSKWNKVMRVITVLQILDWILTISHSGAEFFFFFNQLDNRKMRQWLTSHRKNYVGDQRGIRTQNTHNTAWDSNHNATTLLRNALFYFYFRFS